MSPITLFLSSDTENPNEKDIKKKVDQILDLAGGIFDDIFTTDEWSDYEIRWKELDYKNDTYHYKITRENIELSIKADQLLNQ